ncbi:GxGYxYP domain-containing protein [Actinopolymorpha alba]|uniref:GxGYxYP domain-containing protein n=1 Tax=Actinopolymorpha alba TaxID=533267 RepID=UPI00037C7472|nr:GxGYxYP domain-containing protein [Actinopolymorpha alba]
MADPARISRRTILSAPPALAFAGATFGTHGSAWAEPGSNGILWPADQELPTFARPERLDAIFMADDTPVDVQLLVMTLQGLVNRKRPEIYAIKGNPPEGRKTWLNDSGIPYREFTDPWKVINAHLDRAKGVVVYDPDVVETVNVATTLAGLKDGVIVSPELAKKLTAPPHKKLVLDDLRGRFASNTEATAWQFENLWPQTSHRALLGINPGQSKPIPPDNWKGFVEIAREERPIRNTSNRQVYEFDISAFAGGEKVYFRMQDSQPSDGWGGALHQLTLKADGTVVADFAIGTDTERGVLFDRGGAGFKPQTPTEDSHRFADGNSYFIYELSVPAGARQLTLSLDMFNQFLVSVSKVAPAVSSDDRIPASLPLRDYAVALGAMPFWLGSDNTPQEAELMTRIFAAVEKGTPYLGWYTGEFAGVKLASAQGVYTLAADFLENTTVHSGFRAPIVAQRPAAPPALENKVYLTFTTAEGDNMQYCQHRMRVIWDDPARGRVPMNWSVSPLLIDAAPLIISRYLKTATPNDYLVAGPSGAGYFYPSFWPQDNLATFLAQNKPYFDKLGLDMIYALDDISMLQEASAQAYADQLGVAGIAYNMWFGRSDTTFLADGRLPLSTQIAHSDRNEVLRRIRSNAATDYDGSKPVFIAVAVAAWELGPTDVAWIMDQLGEEFVAVRGDQYFALVREARSQGVPSAIRSAPSTRTATPAPSPQPRQ